MTSTKHSIVLFLLLLQYLRNSVDFYKDKKYFGIPFFLTTAYPLKTQNAALNAFLFFVFSHHCRYETLPLHMQTKHATKEVRSNAYISLHIGKKKGGVCYWKIWLREENTIKNPDPKPGTGTNCPLTLEPYLVLETWSSEGRKGLLTVAEEVFPKAVRPKSLIWERPRVLASRGRWRRRQTAEATSAFTSWI